jgi:parallel beta-helix repeat protein
MFGASGALVAGNRIGTDDAGTSAVPNSQDGIIMSGATTTGNTISRNVVSGNGVHGIYVTDGAQGNTIAGNTIGASLAGGSLPNAQVGIALRNPGTNAVGGPTAAEGNTIFFNGMGGIAYFAGTAANTLGSNRINENGRLGIDLGGDWVTPNDPNDPDTGPNDLVNFPVLSSAVDNGTQTHVVGTLDLESIVGVTVTIQFFSSPACDSLGHGEGERFEGQILGTTDGNGDVSFSANLAPGLVGRVVTATTTVSTVSLGARTSEFSACRTVTGP